MKSIKLFSSNFNQQINNDRIHLESKVNPLKDYKNNIRILCSNQVTTEERSRKFNTNEISMRDLFLYVSTN